MTRINIYRKNLTDPEVEALVALVHEANCSSEQVGIIEGIGEPDPEGGDEVIIVLGTLDTCSDADLELDLEKTPNGGRRVVWIWPDDDQAAELPPVAAKYSYSIIPWNAAKLRNVAADDDVMCFETSNGEPLPKVQTERNLCVDEKAAK